MATNYDPNSPDGMVAGPALTQNPNSPDGMVAGPALTQNNRERLRGLSRLTGRSMRDIVNDMIQAEAIRRGVTSRG